jgi:hypothetical protein
MRYLGVEDAVDGAGETRWITRLSPRVVADAVMRATEVFYVSEARRTVSSTAVIIRSSEVVPADTTLLETERPAGGYTGRRSWKVRGGGAQQEVRGGGGRPGDGE